jgi:hypothetical protein
LGQQRVVQTNTLPNQTLHRTAIPLRYIAGGELGRWAQQTGEMFMLFISAGMQ